MIIDRLKINSGTKTLVDQVEDRLLSYFKEQNFKVGDSIPNEQELALALGVARNVLREALSRLKMIGLIESRTRRGMVLTEPTLFSSMMRIVDQRILSEDTLYGIMGFRVALEIGLSSAMVQHVTDRDLDELEFLVVHTDVFDHEIYTPEHETAFHLKLYQISRNRIVADFQNMLQPMMKYFHESHQEEIRVINRKLQEQGLIVGHKDLLHVLRRRDAGLMQEALTQHFLVYSMLQEQFEHNNLKIINQ